MDNQKILEAARKNKNRGKEFENKVSARSCLVGTFVLLIVGVGLILLEYINRGSFNFGLIAVCLTGAGTQLLVEGISYKKLSVIIISILPILIAVFFVLLFIQEVMFK